MLGLNKRIVGNMALDTDICIAEEDSTVCM